MTEERKQVIERLRYEELCDYDNLSAYGQGVADAIDFAMDLGKSGEEAEEYLRVWLAFHEDLKGEDDEGEDVGDGIVYPTRCQIIDPEGATMNGFGLRAPDESHPHLGKIGWARERPNGIEITLDDGVVLMGYDCWWTPIP